MQGITITPDGTIAEFHGLNELAAYQSAVGGYIQALPLHDGMAGTMYLDEDGKVKANPGAFNPLATAISCELLPGDVVVGTVVIVGPTDAEGNDTPLPDFTLEVIREIAAQVPNVMARDYEDEGGITPEGLALGHRYVMGNVNAYCPKCSEEQHVCVLDCVYDIDK